MDFSMKWTYNEMIFYEIGILWNESAPLFVEKK